MPSIRVSDLLALTRDALLGQGFPPDAASEIAEQFVRADLAANHTHGVTKLIAMNFGDLTAQQTITEHGPILSIDANGGNGFLTLRAAVPLVAARCADHGLALALIRNFSRYSTLAPYTEALARRGLIGILMNSAGPPVTASFGGIDPITGSNPICFSFPLPDGTVQTFDFATSERAWGDVRQAAIEQRPLPHGPFLNAQGVVTTSPEEAAAVRPFGGPRGWSLNLAIEIVAGLLAAGKAGAQVQSEFDCGAILLALAPAAAGASPTFATQIATLFEEIRASRPATPGAHVRLPGDHAPGKLNLATHQDANVDIPATTLAALREMTTGARPSHLAQDKRFN